MPTWIDLQTGLNLRLSVGPAPNTPARVVADDGTAVHGTFVFRQGTEIELPGTGWYGAPSSDPAIDAAGQNVVFAVAVLNTTTRSIHIYHPVDQTDRLLVQTSADLHTPAISADGTRVMFISGSPSASQLYTIGVGDSGALQLRPRSFLYFR